MLLPEPELASGVRPEPLLDGGEDVAGVLGAGAGGGVVWTTRSGVGLLGRRVTTGVAAGTDAAGDDRCEITGCETVARCAGF